MSDEKEDKKENIVKRFINGVKNTMKKIGKVIKAVMSPIGYACGWGMIIIICVILLMVVIKVSGRVLAKLFGDNPNYSTFEEDVEYIKELAASGYELTINKENFQDYQAFEYAVLMDAAEYLRDGNTERISGDNAKIELMEVAYETDQHLLSNYGQDALDFLVNDATARSVKVEDYYDITKSGSVTGGNTRVTAPTLVYEFRKSTYRSSLDSSGDEMTSGDTTTNQNNLTATSQLDGSTQQLLEQGKLKGSLIPYVYIIREDIDFTYYFNTVDGKKRVMKYPYELNINNPTIAAGGSEFAKDLAIRTEKDPDLGTVYPGDSWTSQVFYKDVTTPIVYKIPLQTLIGRYMPRVELLQAWSILKQDIDKEDEAEMVDLVDEVIAAIKGIYNEACLKDEEFETVESGDARYSDATTHKSTFLTFQTAGIEKTMYGINDSLKEVSGEEFKVFTDCVNAAIIQDGAIDVEWRSVKDGQVYRDSFKISDLANDSWKNHGCVIATEADGGGYIPPSSFDSTGICAVGKSANDVISTLKNKIWQRLGGDEEIAEIRYTTHISSLVTDGAAFKYETRTPSASLDINHMRMPILLVKSATTWAREVTYTHRITQNAFDQNSEYYIIPSSVSSLGLMNFQSSVENTKNYRGKAYTEIFARMKEKDVLNILSQLEDSAILGNNDCYEYMRDTYRLLKAAKEYSLENPTGDVNKDINPNTYTYLYIPDSVRYYDDTQTQKIYWMDLFTAVQPTDAITADELQTMRTKKTDLTWQVVEYEKYPECNETGKTLVYALSPFGSSYLRAYYEAVYQSDSNFAQNTEINGSYGKYAGTNHTGADWGGRKRIGNIFAAASGGSGVEDENSDKSSKIFNYELKRLTSIYGESEAKQRIKADLMSEKTNMPIVAVAPGVVTTVTYSSRSGIYVKIEHADGVQTMYMHLKRWPLVDEGDYVGAGTLLGYEGETGRAFGSHLHFQLSKNGNESPAEYIYPTFNPFYNDELAQADGYSFASEYMSLYRTVTMTEDGSGVTNQHPTYALVDNLEDLIQNQGEMDKTIAKNSESGELGWNDSIADSKSYMQYLSNNKYYDLYIKEAYQDYNLAKEEGYLDIPQWLWYIISATDFIVNTEMPGSLPELTREELVYILEHWLPARYGESTFNGMKKVDWLMKNVFTDKNIDKIIEAQNEYHVSAVFALAVATIEQNMGLSGTELALAPNYNIFSIKGSRNGGVRYQQGKLWNKYLGYGDAFEGFDQLIAVNGPYFKDGKYTISAIAPTYCNVAWGNSVSKIATDIMQYYTGSWETSFGTFMLSGGNDEFAKAAENCMNWLNTYKSSFDYGYGVKVPPYKDNFGAPASSNMDCSGYVSWVIYEYGKANGIEALEKIGRWSTSNFKALGDAIKNGRDYCGVAKYFEIVATRAEMPGGNISKVADRLQAGDIILYKEGSGHHVEVLKETGKTKVYTCGSRSGWYNPGAQSYTRRSDVTYIFRLKAGVK